MLAGKQRIQTSADSSLTQRIDNYEPSCKTDSFQEHLACLLKVFIFLFFYYLTTTKVSDLTRLAHVPTASAVAENRIIHPCTKLSQGRSGAEGWGGGCGLA